MNFRAAEIYANTHLNHECEIFEQGRPIERRTGIRLAAGRHFQMTNDCVRCQAWVTGKQRLNYCAEFSVLRAGIGV